MDGLRGSNRSSWGISDNDGLRGSSRGWGSSDSDGLRGMMSGDYDRSSYGSSRSYMESYPSRSERYGPYESHDSRSALDGRDLYRSGYDLHEPGRSRYGDSYPDRSESSYRNFGDQYLDPYEGRSQSRLYDNGRSNWDDSYTHSSSMPRVWADSETGRGSYSSYSNFSTLLSKPSSVGSRGRGMLGYSGNEYGGGSYSMMGGQGGGRGRGRDLSDVDMYSRSGNNQSYNRGGFTSNIGRGMKRKGLQVNKAAVKKQKVAATEKTLKAAGSKAANQTNNAGAKTAKTQVNTSNADQDVKDEDFTKDAYEPDAYECFDKNEGTGKKKTDTEDEEEKKKLEARREKQRRRREKNTEKYGEDYRNAFTCSLCKFRTTEEQEIEAHLETPYHKETLEFIGKNIQFDKGAAEFLHASMMNKNKKIAARKQLQQQEQKEPAQKLSKDVLMGVASDDQMKKVEAVQCAVCNTYIPFLFHSVQQHLKSNEHTNSKKNYHDQVRRESLLTASSMLNNPTVKAKFELFLKGENPFENPQEQQQQQKQQQQEQQEQQPEDQEEEEKQADAVEDQAQELEENQTEMEEGASEPADQ